MEPTFIIVIIFVIIILIYLVTSSSAETTPAVVEVPVVVAPVVNAVAVPVVDKSYTTATLLLPVNGTSIKCGIDAPGGAGGGAVYRLVNGKLNWYPSSTIAHSWDKNWEGAITVPDCKNYIRGPNMPAMLNLAAIHSGNLFKR